MLLEENEQPKKKPTDYTGVVIGVILLPVLLLFIHLDKQDMGRSVCIVLGMIMLAIRVRWDLRRHFWFWAVIVLVLALHVPLFFIFQWPRGLNGWLPAIGSLPIGLADVLIILGAVRFVEKFIVKSPPTEEA
jgi:Ca2+/Na+ antiporter